MGQVKSGIEKILAGEQPEIVNVQVPEGWGPGCSLIVDAASVRPTKYVNGLFIDGPVQAEPAQRTTKTKKE